LFREGLVHLLETSGFEVVARASDRDRVVACVVSHRPDLVITDIRMPPTNTVGGLEAAVEIRERLPGVAVVLLSQYVETTHAVRLLERGASGLGYLLKDRVGDVREFIDAVRRVGMGGSAIDPEVVSELAVRRRQRDLVGELTDREREVLRLMAEGRSNSAIGALMHLSQKTVEGYVRSIFTKLQLEPAQEDHRRVLAVVTYLRA